MTPRVLCIGSVTQDLFFPTNEGELLKTPRDLTAQLKVAFELGGKFMATNRMVSMGGVPGNVSVGLARLGVEAYCYATVGQDEVGTWIRKELERSEVHTETLFVESSVKSDVSAIIVLPQFGDRIIFHNRDASEKLEIDPERIPDVEWLFVSSLNGTWRENLRAIFALKRQRGLSLALNPGQHNLKEDPGLLRELLSEVDVLVLNKDEAIELLLANHIEEDPAKLNDEKILLTHLHATGVSWIGLTDGKRGAWGYDGKTFLHAAIYEPQGLVDTTGAGDAFTSGFLSAHLSHLPLSTALQYGIANAGSVVGAYGGTAGLLHTGEMHRSLKHVSVGPLESREVKVKVV